MKECDAARWLSKAKDPSEKERREKVLLSASLIEETENAIGKSEDVSPSHLLDPVKTNKRARESVLNNTYYQDAMKYSSKFTKSVEPEKAGNSSIKTGDTNDSSSLEPS